MSSRATIRIGVLPPSCGLIEVHALLEEDHVNDLRPRVAAPGVESTAEVQREDGSDRPYRASNVVTSDGASSWFSR